MHWGDGTPQDDRERFRRLANVVSSCFDSCFAGLQTEYVAKVAVLLSSRPLHPDHDVNPERNNRDVTVVMVESAYDPAGLLSRGDD